MKRTDVAAHAGGLGELCFQDLVAVLRDGAGTDGLPFVRRQSAARLHDGYEHRGVPKRRVAQGGHDSVATLGRTDDAGGAQDGEGRNDKFREGISSVDSRIERAAQKNRRYRHRRRP